MPKAWRMCWMRSLPLRRATVHVWSTTGRFVSIAEACQHPTQVAAANWHALTTATARRFAPQAGVLIDVGTTTSDLIPFADGVCTSHGMTDTQRLRTGELVYIGAARTPLMALTPTVDWQGERYGVMAELFATTADVLVLTNVAPPQPMCTDTADGRPLTRRGAAIRILRMVGADLDARTETDAVALAEAFLLAARDRLATALKQVLQNQPLPSPSLAVISGSGEALAKQAVQTALPGVEMHRLSDIIGQANSCAACAHAMLALWGGSCATMAHTS